MFSLPWEYVPEKCPSPLKDLQEEFMKDLADKYQGIWFPIISQLFPSFYDEHEYSRPCPILGNWVMVGLLQPSIKAMAGGGILKDTPSPSPTRKNSPLNVIDVNTLNQEETHDDILEEINNYPSNPMTSVSADENQTHPAGSSNQAVEPPTEGANVSETVQRAADPTKVEVAAMKGKRLPRFSSQLVVSKPLIPALAAITTPTSNPSTHQTEVIFLDDELTASAQETSGPRTKKSVSPSSVRCSKAILPLLTNTGTNSKKGKGESIASDERSSLDCYTAHYMKAPYTLPNGLSN
ncbi:hypothetical protein LIER_26716 [Lithospermum erythrorhizon]|uniref:Uncharacterized protein n=1 Tax=Lithospermum erythrorhizon TaxID=34254 RepID=A0AAV3RCE9_LITER